MPVTEKILKETLESSFPDSIINLVDLAGDNDHWQAEVESNKFDGKNRIEQHRMVQDAVKELDIHALAIKTKVK